MRDFKSVFSAAAICLLSFVVKGQGNYQAPGNKNPLLPGYFADPTVKKFNDTYYIYATTDGNGGGLGPSQVWTSKDFVNWQYQDMNWPTTHFYWAPDVAHGNDGKYYLYYCQPTVEIYGASSTTPVGPWMPLNADNKAVVTNYMVPKVITLDGQTFRDDDGKFYMTWGTWGIYPGHGCGVGLLNPDLKSFAKTAQIPNTLAKDFFEGSFMFKRKGVYYLMYSSGRCEDGTYKVQYAVSKKGPMEGFEYGKNNPILSTSADGTVHGPGHNSLLQEGDNYYIIYHRHNNPHSEGGYNRQVCADKLTFDADGNIEKVIPTHAGIGALGNSTNPLPDLAYTKSITASSYYSNDFKPSFAIDDNNGTLWRPKTNSTQPAWLQVDLGKLQRVKKVLTQFEYATWYYQYKVEYSADGKQWKTFADKTTNTWHGSPYIDMGNVMARYVRLVITNTEYPGLFKAVWNFKVYGDGTAPTEPINIAPKKIAEKYVQKGLLVNMNADSLSPGTTIKAWKNTGALGGAFQSQGHLPLIDIIAGKKAVVFTGNQSLLSSFDVPASLSGNNSYTVAYWVYAGKLKEDNPLLSWSTGNDQLSGAIFGYGTNRDAGAATHFGFADIQYKPVPTASLWHYVAITFDGYFEKIYIDGELNNQENKMLFIHKDKNFMLGKSNNGQSYFNGAVASLQIYDKPLTDVEVKNSYLQVKAPAISVYLDAGKLPYGKIEKWDNEGAAKGMLKATGNNQPQIKDVGGKIAASFSGQEALALNLPAMSNHYTVAFSEFLEDNKTGIVNLSTADKEISDPALTTGKWHYVVKSVNENIAKIYVDGALRSTTTENAKTAKDVNLIIGSQNGKAVSGAVSGICLYNYALNGGDIKAISEVWQQNLHSPVNTAINFAQKPQAISTNMISMKAVISTTGDDLQYNFTRIVNHVPVKQSGWVADPYYIDYGLATDQTYEYSFTIRDNIGNVTPAVQVESAVTDPKKFTVFSDNFSKEKDYLSTDTKGSIWDGIIGNEDKTTTKKIISKGTDTLMLQSTGTNWDGASPYGPFIYKTVKGDFVAEVKVTDVSGLKQRRATNNDAGLMIRAANDISNPTTKHREQLIQNSIFPAYNVGNMLTNFNRNRQQFNIHTAWNFNKFLQIQRSGNIFYVRTSTDRINWTDLPGSPVLRTDLDQKEVQVGLYQCTYGDTNGYAAFSNFKLVTELKQ